ncbi:MAG: DUF5671 domain-containing protein [Patescibacteria group bacterium]|nr:DUF5671 domain-containing protein [Patescibacteria group bacterium]
MQQTSNSAAKFAFFYMLSLVALIFMALTSGMIIFQIINKNIPDILNLYQGRFSPSQLKFAISALVISTPIFYVCMWRIFKNLTSGALEKDSGIRKWLTYFILLVSSVVMLGWLIATINSFLDGEFTTKFILKAITAIFIAAAIFTFYFYDIRRENVKKNDRVIQVYFYASLVLVIAVFVASLFIVESPTQTRNRKYDNFILDNFSNIDSAIASYYQEFKKLPEGLNELEAEYSYLGEDTIKDPASKIMFDYRVVDKNTYELCATFKASNKDENIEEYNYYKDKWTHEAGYQCLEQKVHVEDGLKVLGPVPVR